MLTNDGVPGDSQERRCPLPKSPLSGVHAPAFLLLLSGPGSQETGQLLSSALGRCGQGRSARWGKGEGSHVCWALAASHPVLATYSEFSQQPGGLAIAIPVLNMGETRLRGSISSLSRTRLRIPDSQKPAMPARSPALLPAFVIASG